jgi:hypothetical protein
MSQPARVLIFTTNSALVLTNPDNLGDLLQWKNAILDPDLSLVKHTPERYWKYEYNKVVPMEADERQERDRVIASCGEDFTVRPLQEFGVKVPRKNPDRVITDKLVIERQVIPDHIHRPIYFIVFALVLFNIFFLLLRR